MSNLSAFLAGNAMKDDIVEYEVSKRFIDENKKPIKWKLSCITSDEDESIRNSCTRKVPVPGKNNVFIPEVNYNSYLAKMAVKCIVFPDLNNSELQDSYKVMGAENLLKVMLKPGEYQELIKKIQRINGFDVGMDDLVEEAKN